ncbi:MAG: antitoxin family protein [bacterium]
MTTTLDAVFENGVLKPVQPLELVEGERVRVTVERAGTAPADEILALASCVYEGLSAADVDQIEAMAKRRAFFGAAAD